MSTALRQPSEAISSDHHRQIAGVVMLFSMIPKSKANVIARPVPNRFSTTAGDPSSNVARTFAPGPGVSFAQQAAPLTHFPSAASAL